MQSQPNNELEKRFLKALSLAVKMNEAEQKQKPFGVVVWANPQGEPIHAMRVCLN